jgi:hypothetical protein
MGRNGIDTANVLFHIARGLIPNSSNNGGSFSYGFPDTSFEYEMDPPIFCAGGGIFHAVGDAACKLDDDVGKLLFPSYECVLV